jgi:hypothetical protein
MALTKDFTETVLARAARDAGFRRALLRETSNALDFLNLTVEELALLRAYRAVRPQARIVVLDLVQNWSRASRRARRTGPTRKGTNV